MHGELGPRSPKRPHLQVFHFIERHEQKKIGSRYKKPMSICPGYCADCDDCEEGKEHAHHTFCARDSRSGCPSCHLIPETVFIEVECKCGKFFNKSLAEKDSPNLCRECKREAGRKQQKHEWYERKKAAKEQVC